MREKETFLAGTALALLLSLSPAAPVFGEEEAPNRSEEETAIAEEWAEIAKEEAEVAREALALEEKKAALAERRASAARRQVRLSKRAVSRSSELERQLVELRARETDRGLVLTLGDVLFESGQAKLTADAMRKLYPLVTLVKENPRRDIVIEGHTDSSGAESYNLELSQLRADAVREFLISTGVNPERINARGYGEAVPVASNAEEIGRRENRRVEVVVMREGERVADRTR
jgi:outer membrane protein OmpA-like peptidoglycan-associated protein